MNYKKAAWMSAFLAGALVLAGCQSDSDTEDTTSAVNINTSAGNKAALFLWRQRTTIRKSMMHKKFHWMSKAVM
ncbi:hypothetical protein [[Clostridium] innocuum]|uniref:hypothetical protein n=1 Tax=Clostridium innocuum TaxID=1522 RepID=UPI0022E364DF|nr:hypothetical protein [[Clostridium] innocuum]